MAHNDFISPGLTWGLLSILSSAKMTQFDLRQFEAINGDQGGEWYPFAPILLGGAGLNVTGPLVANSAQIIIGSGKFLSLATGSSFTIAAGATTSLYGAVALNAPLSVGAGGLITFASGTEFELQSGAVLQVDNGAILDLQNGSTFRVEAGALIQVLGTPALPGTAQFGSNSVAQFQQTSSLLLLVGSTLAIGGSATLSADLAVIGKTGSITFQPGTFLTLQAGAILQNDASTVRTGMETRVGPLAMTGHRILPGLLPDADTVLGADYDFRWVPANLTEDRTYTLATNPTPPLGQTIVVSRIGTMSPHTAYFRQANGALVARLPSAGASWAEFAFNGTDWFLLRWGGNAI